jgi:hypothetical protein
VSGPGSKDGPSRQGGRDSDAVDAARFVRGLTIGLIVGAVIAGSTLWRRFGTPRKPS